MTYIMALILFKDHQNKNVSQLIKVFKIKTLLYFNMRTLPKHYENFCQKWGIYVQLLKR